MTDLANTYDTTGTSPVDERGPARLRPSTFEARLREAQALLEGAGCTVDASGKVDVALSYDTVIQAGSNQ